jgi:hypothetical protein
MFKELEQMLLSWTKPPSDTEDSKCENAEKMIRDAIADNEALLKYKLQVFAQGSYANNTNVRLNSDVDIVVRNMTLFYTQYPEGKSDKDFGNTTSDITFTAFKEEVRRALVSHFGEKYVRPGRKAFDILPNGYRIEADVVPSFEHRRYTGEMNAKGDHLYLSGIEFRTQDSSRIISWPMQHKANGIDKNNRTGTRFKKVVRLLRRLNYEMCNDKVGNIGKITGYLIECLCWNLDDAYFNDEPYVEKVKRLLREIHKLTKDARLVEDWAEISDLKWLFRGEKRYTPGDVNNWTVAAWNYLDLNKA